jgi:hypothetical protein
MTWKPRLPSAYQTSRRSGTNAGAEKADACLPLACGAL